MQLRPAQENLYNILPMWGWLATQTGVCGSLTITTVVPCISAVGKLLPPFILLKGERIPAEYNDIVPCDYGFTATKSGSTAQ